MKCAHCEGPVLKGEGVKSYGKIVHRARCLFKRKCRMNPLGIHDRNEEKPIELRTFNCTGWYKDRKQLNPERLRKSLAEDRIVRRMEHWWDRLNRRQQCNVYLLCRERIHRREKIIPSDDW